MTRAHSHPPDKRQAFGTRSSAIAHPVTMKTSASLLAALALLAGCAAKTASLPSEQPGHANQAPLGRAGIGETVFVDGPRVTPLAVLEDSRCPMNARCVWAGRVRIRLRIELGSRSEVRELTLGEPVQVADGSLELFDVQPDPPLAGGTGPETEDYRFGFRFMGGI